MKAKLSYLGLEVGDVASWRDFAVGVLGLQETAPPADGETALALRMDAQRHRFLLRQGAADDIAVIGWELDEEALEAAKARLEAAGVEVTRGAEAAARARGVERLLRFRDPEGLAVELVAGAAEGATPFGAGTVTGFVTGEDGLGHVLLAVADAARTERFYCDVLGFRLSDYVDAELGGHPLHAVFLHTNPRHHSLAFATMPGPKRLHHFMLQVEAFDDVGAALDRARDAGVPIVRTLGRHANDRMVSFYGLTPSGFAFELGWGARRIDDATWQIRTYDRISDWGHRPPAG